MDSWVGGWLVYVISKFFRMGRLLYFFSYGVFCVEFCFKNILKLRKKYSNYFIEIKVRLICIVFNVICNVMYLFMLVENFSYFGYWVYYIF